VAQPAAEIELERPAMAHADSGPAIPFNRLSPEMLAQKKRRARQRAIFNLCGHVIAATLGLMIGYYVLCIISPESNVLELSLPGVSPPAVTVPAAPSPADR
jgi:hypothetical protein